MFYRKCNYNFALIIISDQTDPRGTGVGPPSATRAVVLNLGLIEPQRFGESVSPNSLQI